MQLYQNISNVLKGQDKSGFEGEGSVGTEVGEPSSLHLPLFTDNQRTLVVELILAERRHATRWWTHLSEMRRRKELPEWVGERPALPAGAWSLLCLGIGSPHWSRP